MTITVKITNTSKADDPNSRNVEVLDALGSTHIIAPEQSVEAYVWFGSSPITISELNTRPESTELPSGWGSKGT